MAEFPLIGCLSSEAQVKLAELHGKLGGDVDALNKREEGKELAWGRKPLVKYSQPKEPDPNAPMETTQEIGRIMKAAPHYVGKPGRWRKRPG